MSNPKQECLRLEV